MSQKVGAIRVEMTITGNNSIVGFFCQLGGDTYPNTLNRRQAKVQTGVATPLLKPYVMGSSLDTCFASSTILSVPWFKRNSAGGWTSQPSPVTEYITGSDTVAATTTLVMFVPKPNPVPSILSARIIQPCQPGNNNNTMRIFCPEPLLAVNCSSVSTTATGGGDPACPKALTKPLYHGKVSGTTSFAVSDWVFSDANSVNIPADGYYKTAYVSGSQNQWIQVAGGIVTTIGLCP
jgi:hypothetical protein